MGPGPACGGWWALLAVLATASCRRPEAPSPELLYTLDASQLQGGEVTVELRLRGFPAGEVALRRGPEGSAPTTIVSEVQARSGDRTLPLARRGAAEVWTVSVGGVADEIVVRWRARQGGMGRHGHEGYLGTQFGLVDGGALLLPAAELQDELSGWRGASRLRRVRMRVVAPAGWRTVSTMTSTEDGLDPAIGGRFPLAHLAHSNIAVGPFALAERRIGAVRVRVAAFESWPEAKRSRVALDVFRIYAAFDRETPCRGLEAYTVILLPLADDGRAVAGKFWAAGQAFSYDAYDGTRRAYELVAHRIAHTVNREPLCGFRLVAPDERWFVEGWASWVEVTHGMAAGVIGSEQRLVELGATYRSVALGLDPLLRDAPLLREAASRGEDRETLYLHYTKAPLVVAVLDHELRRRSAGAKTVNGFVAGLHARYGGRAAVVPLRAELAAYVGGSVEAFFSQLVRRDGFIYPLHPGFLEHLREGRGAGAPERVELRVEGRELGTEVVERLLLLLARLKREPAAAREEIVGMQLVHDEYLRRRLTVIPREMIEFADRLPASLRLLLYRHETELLFGDEAQRDRWIATRRSTARVEWRPSAPDGPPRRVRAPAP